MSAVKGQGMPMSGHLLHLREAEVKKTGKPFL
jgi:hypothetical protein